MGVWGLPPGKTSDIRSSERIFLDTFTMLLKYLPTVFKEIAIDYSIRVADCSIRVSQSFLASIFQQKWEGAMAPLSSPPMT